jgi:hypothetical protein
MLLTIGVDTQFGTAARHRIRAATLQRYNAAASTIGTGVTTSNSSTAIMCSGLKLQTLVNRS